MAPTRARARPQAVVAATEQGWASSGAKAPSAAAADLRGALGGGPWPPPQHPIPRAASSAWRS